jgi:hypothetical protein
MKALAKDLDSVTVMERMRNSGGADLQRLPAGQPRYKLLILPSILQAFHNFSPSRRIPLHHS